MPFLRMWISVAITSARLELRLGEHETAVVGDVDLLVATVLVFDRAVGVSLDVPGVFGGESHLDAPVLNSGKIGQVLRSLTAAPGVDLGLELTK